MQDVLPHAGRNDAAGIPAPNNSYSSRSLENPVSGASSSHGTGGGGLFPTFTPHKYGTTSKNQAAKATVSFPVAALISEDEENVPEASPRFVLDGHKDYNRPARRGAASAFTLGSLNALLYNHAQKRSEQMADMLDGNITRRYRGRDKNVDYIVTPEDFVKRVQFIGLQVQNQRFTQGLNWEMAKKANTVLLSIKMKGRERMANFWGDVKEGDKVGWLVRAFPHPDIVGTRDGVTMTAPLRVVPAVQTEMHGVYMLPRLGMPLVDKRSNDILAERRKRPRETLEQQLREYEYMSSSRNISIKNMRMSNLMTDDKSHDIASSVNDTARLRQLTSSNSIYGIDLRDNTSTDDIAPRCITSAYMDTSYHGMITVNKQRQNKVHAFGTEMRNGHFILVGTVQDASRQARPHRSTVRNAVYDPTSNGLDALRNIAEIYIALGQ